MEEEKKDFELFEDDLVEDELIEENDYDIENFQKIDLVKLYLNDIGKYQILTDDEVRDCYKYLNSTNSIQILKEKNISSIMNIDLATIFKSCCFIKDYKLVLDVFLNYYATSNNKYEKEYYSKIKKYMLIAEKKERSLTEIELIENFDIDFEKAQVLKEHDLLVDIGMYFKCRNSYNKMFNSNLKLVVSVAKKYKNSYEFLDIINEGNIGLIKAIEKFDISLGYKFSTYATWWIKQYIRRAIQNQKQNIRLPSHLWEKIHKYKRQVDSLEQELGYRPNKEEISKKLGYTLDDVNKYENYSYFTISLDQPINDDNDVTMGDFVESNSDVSNEVLGSILTEDIVELFSTLSDREKEIIMKRYGFNEKNIPMTLQEVGDDLNITRERVRQIEFKALRKMKNFSRRGGYDFNDYLE